MLTRHADRTVLTVGREARGYPAHEVNMTLASELGRHVIELPGGHVATPPKFAHELMHGLTQIGLSGDTPLVQEPTEREELP